MKFDKLNIYQNAWYRAYGIKRITFYHYKDIFENCDLKAMNGDSGLQKSRSNTIVTMASVSNIVDQNSNKDLYVMCLVC